MDKATAFLRHFWKRMKSVSSSDPKSSPNRQKLDNGLGTGFNVAQEARRNYGMVAAILILSISTIVLEIIAHSSFRAGPDRNTGELHHAAKQESTVSPTRNHCGSSPAEARQLGCLFDELSFAWQVPECFDETTINEFLAASKWEYFSDEAGTIKVGHDELALGRNRSSAVHVTWAFHITHCLFLRRQMVRALEHRAAMDSHLGAYKHTVHCGKTMLNWRAGSLHTQAPVIYPVCKPLKDWRA